MTAKKVSGAELIQALTELKTQIESPDFRSFLASKYGTQTELDFSTRFRLALDFSLTAAEAFEAGQTLELELQDLSELTLSEQKLTVAEHTNTENNLAINSQPLAQGQNEYNPNQMDSQSLGTLPSPESEFSPKLNSQIYPVLKKLPKLLQNIGDNLPESKNEFEKWHTEFSAFGAASVDKIMQMVNYENNTKTKLNEFIEEINKITEQPGGLNKQNVAEIQAKLYLIVQDFADFDNLQHGFVENLTKFIGNHDFIADYFFEMYNLLSELNESFIKLNNN